MNNLLVLPVLLPMAIAVFLMFFRKNIRLQRVLGVIGGIANVVIAGVIVHRVRTGGIQTLELGGWAPPYGIVFVADMFAALLVLAASVTGLAVLIYSFASIGREREEHYYYTSFHFLLVGVYGSFLTGDIFNLFVFFEVMLISSYALITLGGSKKQMREAPKYLLVNILSSTLFVAAVAYLYAAVGTLNMAHLSQRIAEAGQGGVLNVIAVLFLIVFSLKAGLFLFFWLPSAYGAPPFAVRALFGGLLTKVGLYAIVRTFTLIFPNDPSFTHAWIAGMAAATMILGGIGAAAYRDIPRILNYNVLIGVGFVAFGLATGTRDGMDGVVFYMLHDILSKGLMFVLGGMLIAAAGSDKLDRMGGLIRSRPGLGWMFFILALALTGIPPLSGFAGKVLIVRGGLEDGMVTLSLVALASSLLTLYSLIKIFREAFWGTEPEPEAAAEMLASGESDDRQPPRAESGRGKQTTLASASAVLLLLFVIGIGLAANGVHGFAAQAGATLDNPGLYIEAVLKE
ncbi:Na+/H+ antiporter subunit D [Saccharibacillus alkalitolerans]|uniref:Na+/H+ antiporter subunit D n=1 Tax=Saccharibacillus alkalitolerans TaxID=2705290 RepID=A0ABX0F9Y0_9BACL|nr:Na+/H+ antiporter subunit D [Saccharibacillus alkalitolerans]NGZ76779.1 Na+/H+ antiporter subunit D [Saccharibacillus alkalitolerans]